MRTKTLFIALSLALLASSIVWATTLHTITIDGKLSDFAADEKLPADPASDSIFGVNNELKLAHLTWDAENLYLGFDFRAWGVAVMYLIDLNSSTGATSFCPTAGYNGSFPANFMTGTGTNADLMVALYAPNKATPSISAYAYKLTAKSSSDITKSLPKAPVVSFTTDTVKQVHTGAVEVAIPWNTIYGLGKTKVPKCAWLGLAGVLRGQYDNSALGDINPDGVMGDKSHNCYTAGSKISSISKWHKVDLDKDCDQFPDKNWMPGSNKAKPLPPDAGVPDLMVTPDQKVVTPDQKVVTPDQKVTKDQAATKDQKVTPDQKVTKDQAATKDQKVTPDQKVTKDLAAATDQKAAKDTAVADKGAGDKGAGDKGAGDQGAGDKGAAQKDKGMKDAWGEDSGYLKPVDDGEGCACSATGSESMAMGLFSMGGLLALAFLPGCRRRRRR